MKNRTFKNSTSKRVIAFEEKKNETSQSRDEKNAWKIVTELDNNHAYFAIVRSDMKNFASLLAYTLAWIVSRLILARAAMTRIVGAINFLSPTYPRGKAANVSNGDA